MDTSTGTRPPTSATSQYSSTGRSTRTSDGTGAPQPTSSGNDNTPGLGLESGTYIPLMPLPGNTILTNLLNRLGGPRENESRRRVSNPRRRPARLLSVRPPDPTIHRSSYICSDMVLTIAVLPGCSVASSIRRDRMGPMKNASLRLLLARTPDFWGVARTCTPQYLPYRTLPYLRAYSTDSSRYLWGAARRCTPLWLANRRLDSTTSSR